MELAALVGHKYQSTACRSAQLCAKRMIVGVRVSAKVTIRVGDLASEGHRLAAQSLPGKQFNVSLVCHSSRPCQVRSQGLHLREWHIVQAVSIPELESTQPQRREETECCDSGPFN